MCGVITIRNYGSHSEISHPSWGGGGHSRLMWWTGRRTMGGWVSLFEENTSGALGGAPDTTPNDNCDRFPPPLTTPVMVLYFFLTKLVMVLYIYLSTLPCCYLLTLINFHGSNNIRPCIHRGPKHYMFAYGYV